MKFYKNELPPFGLTWLGVWHKINKVEIPVNSVYNFIFDREGEKHKYQCDRDFIMARAFEEILEWVPSKEDVNDIQLQSNVLPPSDTIIKLVEFLNKINNAVC